MLFPLTFILHLGFPPFFFNIFFFPLLKVFQTRRWEIDNIKDTLELTIIKHHQRHKLHKLSGVATLPLFILLWETPKAAHNNDLLKACKWTELLTGNKCLSNLSLYQCAIMPPPPRTVVLFSSLARRTSDEEVLFHFLSFLPPLKWRSPQSGGGENMFLIQMLHLKILLCNSWVSLTVNLYTYTMRALYSPYIS